MKMQGMNLGGDGGLFSLNFAMMSVPIMTIAIIFMNCFTSSLI